MRKKFKIDESEFELGKTRWTTDTEPLRQLAAALSACTQLEVLRLNNNALCGQTSYGYGPRNEGGLLSLVGTLESMAHLKVRNRSPPPPPPCNRATP